MKKISYILIIITLLTLLTACGAKQKMEEKIAEKIIEQAIGGADIDID
jgi:predicted small lipoprotein YifL